MRARPIVVATVFAMLGATPAPAQRADDGLDTYTAYGCYQCHGYAGQGGIAGPRIAPSPYPYTAFAQLVRRPSDEMPAYAASVLSDEDLREIYDYLRSVTEPPAVDDIDILAALTGEEGR
jgi:mono/diheme cytochrome c family protein